MQCSNISDIGHASDGTDRSEFSPKEKLYSQEFRKKLDFLANEAGEKTLNDFPEPKQLPWSEFDNEEEHKLPFDEVRKLRRSVRDVL